MSGIGGGDTLQALLNVVANPKLHQSKLDELSKAQQEADDSTTKLVSAQKQLKADRAAVDADRASLNTDIAAFATQKKAILDRSSKFDDREKVLAAAEAKLAAEKKDFVDNSGARQVELDQRIAAVKRAEADVSTRLDAVQDLQSRLATRQAEVDKKLEAIKALAK